jgi:hypothetical protein
VYSTCSSKARSIAGLQMRGKIPNRSPSFVISEDNASNVVPPTV